MQILAADIENAFVDDYVLATLDEICFDTSDDDYVNDVSFLIGKRWHDITVQELVDNIPMFFGLSFVGFQKFIPSIILASLDNTDQLEETLLVCLQCLQCQESAVFIDAFKIRLSKFTSPQIELVKQWLAGLGGMETLERVAYSARKALICIEKHSPV